jgi:hypothetical protein
VGLLATIITRDGVLLLRKLVYFGFSLGIVIS